MRRLFAIHDRIIEALVHLPGAIVALMAVGICIDVLLRNLGLGSFPWMLEVVEYALYGLTFAGTAAVLKHNRHVRVDLWGNAVPDRVRALSDVFVAVVMSVMTAVLLYYGVKAMLTAMDRNAMLRQYFDVPEWVVLLVLPIAWTLVLIECLRQVAQAWTALVRA